MKSPLCSSILILVVSALLASCTAKDRPPTMSGERDAAANADGGAQGDGDTSARPDAGDGDTSMDGGPAGDGDAGMTLPADDDHPPLPVSAASPWRINSPDNDVVVEIALDAGTGTLSYRLEYRDKEVLAATDIGLRTSLADFSAGLAYVSGATRVLKQHYRIPTGKRSDYFDHANELTLTFGKDDQRFDLVVRAYDDGGAYRFALASGGEFRVDDETGGFRIPSGAHGFASDTALDYQGNWDARSEDQLKQGEFDLPVLIETSEHVWALFSEAAVYATAWASHVNGDGELLRLNGESNRDALNTPFESPWRVVMVGSELATIVESSLIENLNPPSEIADTSWIKPGRSAWSWWSGASTSDYDTQVKYVDFAASMGWEYYLCDEGWQASWMPQLITYAAGKGVGIWLWISGDNMDSDDKINTNIQQWSDWGIKGIKVDYVFDRLNIYDKVAKTAADHHLMVNYHGCTKPSGERRRYPHLMTREAIYGAEQYKTGHGPTAKFNTILPFTRNVQGPMDYTPVTYSDHGQLTTAAHQTALDVVFESGVQHLADSPESYQQNVAKDFLAASPSVWDETRLIAGTPGEHVIIARRTGKEWFVGSISAGDAHTAEIPLSFLGAGSYAAEIYRDGDSDDAQVKEMQSVTAQTVLKIVERNNGGCALHLKPE